MPSAQRLFVYWVYGGTIAGLLLLCLTPFLARDWTAYETLVFLALPVYMIHQYEEHDADRFRLFINAEIGKGREVLTHFAVFVINVIGVWGTLAVAFALTLSVRPGAGLFAGYLLLVNAFVHAMPALLARRYNPGLVTGVLLFLPLGGLVVAEGRPAAGLTDHIAGLGLAVLIHVAIVIHVKRQMR